MVDIAFQPSGFENRVHDHDHFDLEALQEIPMPRTFLHKGAYGLCTTWTSAYG